MLGDEMIKVIHTGIRSRDFVTEFQSGLKEGHVGSKGDAAMKPRHSSQGSDERNLYVYICR